MTVPIVLLFLGCTCGGKPIATGIAVGGAVYGPGAGATGGARRLRRGGNQEEPQS